MKSNHWGSAMNAFEPMNEDEEEGEGGDTPLTGPFAPETCGDRNDDEILRLLIGEGTEAAMDMYFEAKDPNIDPALKLKLIGLASRVGDNVRKAIATHTTCFGARGRTDV
jgi:hypothetical protein